MVCHCFQGQEIKTFWFTCILVGFLDSGTDLPVNANIVSVGLGCNHFKVINTD